ncbi:hypothetical protein [Dissulfurispira sp.]|uniref:hypothetical protein n=1 Tax=Dissulfurispira sp. TaxID=2817609 RepID=UPI002FD9FDCA
MFKQKVSLIDRRLAGTKDTISSQIVKLGEKREQLEKEMSGIRQFYEEVTGAMKERAAFAKDTGSMEKGY